MKRAFTLLELMVIVAIVAAMVTVGVFSITAGQGAARVKGATRDVYATIRHARSRALVTMKPVVVTYSTVREDDTVVAKIELVAAEMMNTQTDRSRVRTLSGEPLLTDEQEPVAQPAEADGEAGSPSSAEGMAIEDILFKPIGDSVVSGMRVKVVLGDDDPGVEQDRPSKISVFSNVDYITGRYKSAREEAKKKAAAESAAESGSSSDAVGTGEELQEPVSVVWETNGRVDPHQIWIYPDGERPEDGMLIRIDRFGAAKVLSGDGREDN